MPGMALSACVDARAWSRPPLAESTFSALLYFAWLFTRKTTAMSRSSEVADSCFGAQMDISSAAFSSRLEKVYFPVPGPWSVAGRSG